MPLQTCAQQLCHHRSVIHCRGSEQQHEQQEQGQKGCQSSCHSSKSGCTCTAVVVVDVCQQQRQTCGEHRLCAGLGRNLNKQCVGCSCQVWNQLAMQKQQQQQQHDHQVPGSTGLAQPMRCFSGTHTLCLCVCVCMPVLPLTPSLSVCPSLSALQLADSSPLKRELVEGVDILIVRELVGGIYFGQPRVSDCVCVESGKGHERGCASAGSMADGTKLDDKVKTLLQ